MSGFFKGFSFFEEKPEEKLKETCQDFLRVKMTFAGHVIWINQAYIDLFIQLNNYIHDQGYLKNITRVDSFNCRYTRTVRFVWSYHSYGQAIDINPSQFPMVKISKKYDLPEWYNDLLQQAKAIGFRVGRDFKTVYDPMHLELGIPIRRKS